MKVFRSDNYRAELSNEGIINVFSLEGRKIKEMSFDGADVSITEHTAKDGAPMLRSLLDVMDNCPVFRAAFAQNDVFHVDHEAGTQRWKGYKTIKEVEDALLKCEFSVKDIELILQKCKQTCHTFLPRVG